MIEDIVTQEPKVTLLAMTQGIQYPEIGPEELSAFGALACFEEKSTIQLYEEEKSKADGDVKKRASAVVKNSFGRGHGSVADQNYFIFAIENLTRAATLQLCLPHYLAHLQQSLRRAKADRAFYLPEAIRQSELFNETKDLLFQAFSFYEEMSEGGVPSEDARFVLPLYTKTNIQTGGDARELTHLLKMNGQGEVPSAVSSVVTRMVDLAKEKAPSLLNDWGKNYEVLAWYPSAQMYFPSNDTLNQIIAKYSTPDKTTFVEFGITEEAVDKAVKERNETELANLKHIHNGNKIEAFLIPMSIACYHQSTRQRTWDHSIESIYDAAERGDIVVPPSIQSSDYAEKYTEFNKQMIDLYKRLVKSGVPRKEAIGVVPHSLIMYDMIHVNGWNSLHSIGKRTCTEAQWEIRAIARDIAKVIKERNPSLGKWAEPQGVIYGQCPERKSCGYCDQILKSRKE